MHTITCTILLLIIRFTLIILATCTNKTTSTIQIVPPSTRTSLKAYKPHPRSGSSAPLVARLPSIPISSPTSTIPTTSNMPKALTTTVRTRTASRKKKDSAADELQKQVALEKKKRELNKKQRASEKQAEEEKKKKSDQEKADENAGTITVSPPNNNEEVVTIGSEDEEEMESNFEYSQASKDADWIGTEDAEALERLGISPTTSSERTMKKQLKRSELLRQSKTTPREQKWMRAPRST